MLAQFALCDAKLRCLETQREDVEDVEGVSACGETAIDFDIIHFFDENMKYCMYQHNAIVQQFKSPICLLFDP